MNLFCRPSKSEKTTQRPAGFVTRRMKKFVIFLNRKAIKLQEESQLLYTDLFTGSAMESEHKCMSRHGFPEKSGQEKAYCGRTLFSQTSRACICQASLAFALKIFWFAGMASR